MLWNKLWTLNASFITWCTPLQLGNVIIDNWSVINKRLCLINIFYVKLSYLHAPRLKRFKLLLFLLFLQYTHACISGNYIWYRIGTTIFYIKKENNNKVGLCCLCRYYQNPNLLVTQTILYLPNRLCTKSGW